MQRGVLMRRPTQRAQRMMRSFEYNVEQLQMLLHKFGDKWHRYLVAVDNALPLFEDQTAAVKAFHRERHVREERNRAVRRRLERELEDAHLNLFDKQTASRRKWIRFYRTLRAAHGQRPISIGRMGAFLRDRNAPWNEKNSHTVPKSRIRAAQKRLELHDKWVANYRREPEIELRYTYASMDTKDFDPWGKYNTLSLLTSITKRQETINRIQAMAPPGLLAHLPQPYAWAPALYGPHFLRAGHPGTIEAETRAYEDLADMGNDDDDDDDYVDEFLEEDDEDDEDDEVYEDEDDEDDEDDLFGL